MQTQCMTGGKKSTFFDVEYLNQALGGKDNEDSIVEEPREGGYRIPQRTN